eukprot:432760_1
MGSMASQNNMANTSNTSKKQQLQKNLKAYYQSLGKTFDDKLFNEYCSKHHLTTDTQIQRDINNSPFQCKLVKLYDDFPFNSEPTDIYNKKEKTLYVLRQCLTANKIAIPLSIPQSPLHTWSKVNDSPFDDYGFCRCPVVINNEIILSPTNDPNIFRNHKDLYAFNTKSKTWDTITFREPGNPKHDLFCHAFCGSNDGKYLYLYDGTDRPGILLVLDVQQKKVIKIIKNLECVGLFPVILVDPDSNNILHVIGGDGNRSACHFTLNMEDEEMKLVHTFNEAKYNLCSGGIIYLRDRKEALLFHGLIDVYLYSFNDRKWENTKIKFPIRDCAGFGFVATEDQKYILIFGGSAGYVFDSNNIFIFDVNKMRFTKSNVKCPQFGRMDAAITRGGCIHLFHEKYHWTKHIGDILSEYNEDEKKNDDDSDLDEIENYSISFALVLIVCISSYKYRDNLPGVKSDKKNMINLWQNDYKYHVLFNDKDEVNEDTWDDILIECRYILCKKANKNKFDSLFMIYSGHGSEDKLILSDNTEILREDIVSYFNGKNVKPMSNKPKIMIMDACRGNIDMVEASPIHNINMKGPHDAKHHKDAGFILIYPTTKGFSVPDNTENGGNLIRTIYRIFKKDDNINKYDLVHLLKLTHKKVTKLCDGFQCLEIQTRG